MPQILPQRRGDFVTIQRQGLFHALRRIQAGDDAGYQGMGQRKLQRRGRQRHAMPVAHRFDPAHLLDHFDRRGLIIIIEWLMRYTVA